MTYAAEASRPTYPALAEVSRVIASHGDLSEVFEKLAECLRPLLGFHYLSVALHDDGLQVMRLHVLQSLQGTEPTPGLEFPITESPSGEVWPSQERRNFGSLNELRDGRIGTSAVGQAAAARSDFTLLGCDEPILGGADRKVGQTLAGSLPPLPERDVRQPRGTSSGIVLMRHR